MAHVNENDVGLNSLVENITKQLESQIDTQLELLQIQPDEDELAAIRAARVKAIKERQVNEQKWKQAGHGEYTELSSEKDFFPTCTASNKVVAHFYSSTTFRCEIVDSHLKKLAPLHLETKFIKLKVDKAPFLTEKLNIKVIPSILICVDGTIVDRIVGFTTLGNTDSFSTEMLEWRLGIADGLDYKGDKNHPPESSNNEPKKFQVKQAKKTVRSGGHSSSSSEEED